MRRKYLLLLSVITLSLTLFGSHKYIGQAQEFCGQTRGCYTDFFNTCIPTPTTLPAVNVNVRGDWHVEDAGSHCGGQKCYVVLVCECGPPLGDRLCTSREKA
jgi:hypothetical protein